MTTITLSSAEISALEKIQPVIELLTRVDDNHTLKLTLTDNRHNTFKEK